MSISRKFQRSKSKYTLSQKIISAVTAAGFIMQPFTAFAGEIVKPGGENLIKDNVANIWADRVVDKTAINVFNKFNLSQNEIANMYFGLKDTKHDAANLVNFVNDRIDINGTVNAIQNSQIGGNLFFLSKDGMAVGKSGVINTGSLYVMTPTQDYIKNMKVVAGTADAATAEKELNAITNITKDANAWQAIPVNASGTITVLGKVNATNEVQMRAAKIGGGKNVSGELTDDEGTVIMEADAANKEAYIKTGITNFADIVNIKNADGTAIITESGLTGDLQATQTGSGDIVLSAYVDGATKENKLEKLPFIGGTFGPIAETAENTFVEQDFNASVDVYGYVETTGEEGHININATAVNSNVDVKDGNYVDNKNTDVAQLANVKAEVNIGGTVNAAEDVTVKAEAINRYIDNSGAVAKAVSVGVSSGTPITGDVAYSVLNTEANVNITSDGSIKSGKGVDIDAKAETLAASAASVTALKFKAAGGTTGANVPAVSVLYTNAVNKANVTVEGNINAAEGNINAAENISIEADADMKVDAENKMGIKGKMGNQFVVGVTVAGAENSASVDIKDEDNSNNVINAGNDLSVNANATSDFTSGTSIKAPEASAMAVAVNVTDFNSNANVNIDTDLTAGNDLTVKADNIITDDNVIAESTIGSGKYVSAATQVVTGHVEQKKGEVKDFISGLAAKLGKDKKLPIGDDDDIPGLQLSEIFKAGATVTYSGQKHDSSVTIGKNASLKANEGKLDIGALTKIEDAHITATGTTSSYNDAYPAELTVNAAVLLNNMDNSSSVVVADRDEGSADALKGKNGVSVNASTRFEYNRIKNMIQDVKDAANQIASAVGGLDGSIKNDFNGFINTLNKQIDAWESAFKTADETLATSDKGVLAIGEAATAGYNVLTALNNLNTMLDNRGSEVAADTKAAIQGASDLLTSALAFADPNSYGNFAASSASKGSSGDTSSIAGHHSSAVNGAGTVMVNTVNSVSKVEIGSNAVINAVGKVELNAENYMKDVSLGGLNAVPLTNSGGGTAASIGATVNYSDFNTDTVVAVNDGAAISGGDINIAGSNEIDHVSVAGSAGMGPSDETESKGIVLNGMLSFVDGSSDILTVVDDGAKLTANAQKQYTETVINEETGEETEETKTSEGSISISGHNDTNIVNVAAGLNLGSGSGAVGVGLAYNDFAVKNIAGVADVAEQIEGLYGTGTGDVTFANKYNKETAKDNEGGISAYGFDVDAATEGSIQSVSVAASASKNDDTGEVSFFGKIKGGISNVEKTLLDNGGKLDQVTGKIFGTESGKANDFFNMGSKTHGANGDGIKIEGGTSGKGGFMPSFSIAGSGSVSLNVLDNATEAIVDNAKISMKDKGDISVTARDALYAGAYSGAAALQWKSGGSASDTSAGFSGAAGVNDIDNVIKATISNSVINDAGTIDTLALSGGEQLALGLGLNVAKSGSTSGYTGNAAVSVNLIDHDVEALHENNTVTSADDINVAAYARDIENTGGGSLSAGQQKVGVGASVGVAMLNNNISAGIKGGSYTNVGSVDVEALNALKNITVGIAAGLTIPSDGNAASANVEGAGVYNEVHNTTNAFIESNDTNNKVGIETVDGGEVSVIAQDVAINENSVYEMALENLADGKEEIAKRMGAGYDVTGQDDLNDIDMSDAITQTGDDIKVNKEGGSSIITVAGGIAGTTGKGAGGAAVAITDIENTYTAKIDYADITAETVSADAGSNSNIVTVAGGIAAASKGSGVGSVSWNDVVNTANVDILNSTVKAQSTIAEANNAAQIVSVGGQISGAGKAAVGATLSYVGLDNTTKVNISTTEFDERTANEGTSVTAKANNTSDSYNIGAGVSAGGTASVSGTVVVTQTKGTAGAVMDGAKINNAKEIIAHASDDTDILSVIGTVNIAGKAAVGAGVAYTEIGGDSDDKEKAEQHVTAEIKNSTINTDDAGSTVEVKAEDEARVINVAVGVGGAVNAAVQGASATTLINKETSAGINSTNIDAGHEGSTKANVTVDAQNSSEITSSADVAAAAGSGAGVGAGIAVNRIIQQTNATVNGGTMNINNLTVNANAAPRIENIGIGAGVAGTGAGVTGSVAVNMIENDVAAHIGGGANIVADDNVGVVATSDEQIANYVGSASVAGTGAAVGASVSVNKITGTTSATVGDENTDTKVTAKGNGSDLTSNTIIYKNTINNALIDNDTVDIDSHIARGKESRKGLIVDASSTRDMKSFLINASVAGEGAGVTGTVNVNMIDGATEAGITDTVVNGGSTAIAGQNANVFVNAGDYTNSSGFVGGASVAGIGGGVGLASDTNTVERTTSAIIEDSDIKADKFEVDADSMQGVSSFTVSAGVAGIGAGVSGVVSVTDLKNTTQAAFFNSKVTADTVDIKATHKSIINAGNVGVGAAGLGAGVGLSVGVLKDNSETRVDVGDNEITLGVVEESEINAEKDVNVAATNNAVVKPVISATGAGAAGAAGAISINNINSVVKTNINHADINSKQGNITGNAQNAFDIDAYMGGNAAGAFGSVGVSVTVNTIDSTIQTNVTDSELTAENGDITLTAEETRNIEQIATNVSGSIGVSAGANIAITNVGEDVENDENSNAADKIAEANNMYSNNDGNDIGSLMGGASDALNTARINDAVPTIGAGYGGDKDSQITVNITGSDIDAGNTITAKATESDNISMTLGSGAAGAAAVNAGVGILNVLRNVGVNINGGQIDAQTVDIGTDITGEGAELNVYQGTGGLLGVNAAYAGITTTGNSQIVLQDGTVINANDVNITAADNGKSNLQAVGVAAGGVALGALAAEAENDSDIKVEVSKATINAEEENGNVTITSKKNNTVTAQAIGVAGGAIGGAGMGANVTDKGSSTVSLIGNKITADNNIDVDAITNSTLTANINNDAAGVFASGAVSIATVNAGTETDHMITSVDISAGNVFTAENTSFDAKSAITQDIDMLALSLSGYVAIGGNTTTTSAYADATITADAYNTYKGTAYETTEEAEDGTFVVKTVHNAGDVSFNADNTVTQTSDARGVDVGGIVATGTNIGKTISNLITEVDINGSNTQSNINELNANADSVVTVNNTVNGDGGGLVDVSPYAAQTANKIKSTTNVNVSGNWNIAGDMNVEALHTNDVTLNTDALKASVVGLSGVHSDNDITNNTGVTFSGVNVTTGGSQDISARNDIDYTADITGSGYGVAQGAAVWAQDNMTLNADVNVENSTLDAKGSIDINALTGDAYYNGINKPNATIDKEVTIKSAGVVAGTYAESTDEVTFVNNINVGSGSSVITSGTDIANADITMTAADRTNFKNITTADTQGGVIGAAGTKLENDIIRTNAITVGGMVDSNYDANFDAGDSSVLNLTLKSNAYNKTAAPLATNPSISGVVTQNSAIDFASGSTVKSFRNINAAAGVGDTTVAKESKTWRWVDGGVTGTGSISSTSDGTLSGGDAKITTTVTVDGTLEAGKNHQLDITIDYAENGKENLDGAINSYGETLANGSLKPFEEAVDKAQAEYDKFVEETGLDEKTEELNALEEKYQNNSIVYEQLDDEYDIVNGKYLAALENYNKLDGDLQAAGNARDEFVNNAYAQYVTDHPNTVITKDAFEAGLALGTDLLYGKENIEKYKEHTDTINNLSEQVKAADELKENLDLSRKEKEKLRDNYKVDDEMLEDLAEKQAAIDAIKADGEYDDKLTALKNAQQNYNDALSDGVSADRVNAAIFGTEGKYIDVTASKWLGDNKGIASVGMADYAAGLLTRYDELAAMMQDYTGTDVSAAYSAEMNRIQNELRALGIGSIVEQNGKQVFVVAEGASTVPTIELDNLMVSGGNVNISADTLKGDGTGEIIAHGKPSVTITNNTDFFLHVNDVVIDSDGGKVLHNNVAVDKHDKIDITSEPGDSAGNNGQITIQNTTITTAANSNIYTPDIGIYGNVSNPFGNITIKNAHNSIYVAGEVTDSAGNVLEEGGSITGRTINLSAGGSVTQGYSDDIKNISGDPQNAVNDDTISAIQQALIDKLGNKTENGKYYTAFETPEDLEAFLATVPARDDEGNILKDAQGNTKLLLTPEKAEEYALRLTGNLNNSEPGISAGGAIYINAASINVNGKIQSGYESYKLNINSDKKIEGKGDILKNLINSYQKPEGEITTDYSKYMTDDYLVTLGESGAVYENGKFVYNIKAWYNPETNEIFTEDIEQAGGGRIYLTGAIANTNSQKDGGKLIVLDGGSNYIINGTVGDETTNNFTFKLGSINAETVNGYIEINDTSSGQTVTNVYTNNIPSGDDKIAGATYHNVGVDGMKYQPTTGLYYNWSNGEASRVITSYKSVTDTSWFGLDKDSWEQKIGQLSQVEKDSMQDGEQINISGLMDTESSMIAKGQIDTGENGYEYIDVGTSSEKNNTTNNNIYQITFQRQGKPKQGVDKDGNKLYLTKDENNNDILTIVPNDRPYYLKNEDGTYVYEVEVSEPVATTKKKGLFGLWGKTITTEWKETSGMITAYNFGLKADNSIGIEFVGNKTSTGIITSNSDILLGGDIHMGTVKIESTAGKIYHEGDATVISDDATFNAQTGIDVIQKNVDKNLHLNAVSAGGNINIQAIAANGNNNVYVDNVSTTGNVSITAEGSLLTDKGDAVVLTGNGITLQSYGGGIDLVIDGGTEGTNAYAVDDISLTEANGHMYLGEIVAENGDVVLEVKESGAGFVDAIVNNSNGNKDSSRVDEWKKLGLLDDGTNGDQLNNWDNQKENLANAALNGSMFMDKEGNVTLEEAQEQGKALLAKGEEFVTLMKGGSEAVQEAREDLNAAQGALNEAIANLGDDAESKAAYKTALEEYNAAYDHYAEVGADYEQQKATFIENSGFKDNKQAVNWLTNYEAIGNAEADNYGWTQQQLLYAVQDTVINPNAGSVSDVKTANVTGNNITFISDTGNLGVVDTQETTIGTDELTAMFTKKGALTVDEQAKLDKLSSARAGDVVWGDTDITIERTTPVSIKLNKNRDGETTGTVTVQSKDGVTTDHIYLLAKDSVLNANEFAANDLRLSGQEGLNVNKVTGNSIYLEGGSGDIGALDKTLQAVQVALKDTTDTTGKVINGFVSANAAGNVALQQVDDGNFTLGSVAGTEVNIIANGDIVSRTDDISYINASDTITLISGGGIGTSDKGLRIKNSGAVVNTDVQDAIYIEAKQDGTLILGKMEQAAGGVNVDSEGSIYIGKEDDPNTDEKDDVLGYIEAKNDVNLHAAEDIIISGMLHVNKDNGNLNLHADNGDITQTTSEATENIAVDNLTVAAIGGDVKLDNPYNVIEKVDLQAVGGSLGLTVSNADGFNVEMGGFTNKKGGDVTLTNSDGSVKITTQDITDPKKQDEANINGSLTVTADKVVEETEANVNNYGILNATGDISFNAEDNVNNKGAVKAGADVDFDAGNDVNNENAVKAGTDVSFGAGNDIINNDIVDAGRNVNFNAAEDIYNNSTVNADETIEFTAVDGVINSDTVNGKDVIMHAIEQELENILAKDSVTLNGDRIHGQNITQNTEADGDLIINTDSNSGSGPIESLVIDKIDANDKSVFTELWAVEADITTVDDKMDFNDIMIEENAWLENSGTLATIYGNVPVKDDDANVHIYQSYPSMYVNFIDADTVETDGRLLSLDDYWYAYDQRFTAENHLRWHHGRYLDEDWKQAYGYGLSLHNRYGLIDYQEFTETNAGADEVAVEA